MRSRKFRGVAEKQYESKQSFERTAPFSYPESATPEIQMLLRQYTREERREEIYQNFESAQIEQQNGELKFSANLSELRQLIEE